MKRLGRILRRMIQHPKTSATGCALIATGVLGAIAAPPTLATPVPYAAVLGGIGLLLAPDADKVARRGQPYE